MADESPHIKSYLESLVYEGQLEHLSAPVSVSLDLTRRCNLQCVFCYAKAEQGSVRKVPELGTEAMRSILFQLAEAGVFHVVIGGGEPFIRDDMVELLAAAKEAGLEVYVVSNGMLITSEIAERLKELLGPLDTVQISLDSGEAAQHNALRRSPVAFERATRGLKLLKGGRFDVLANMVVTRMNRASVSKTVEVCSELGVESLRLLQLQPIGFGVEAVESLSLSREEERALYHEIKQLNGAKPPGGTAIVDEPAAVHWTSVQDIAHRMSCQARPNPVCPAGTSTCSIDHEGRVFPCTFFNGHPEMAMGSLQEKSFRDIWNDAERWRVFRKPLELEGKCVSCKFAGSCHSGCPAMSYAVDGRLGAPDPMCKFGRGKAHHDA
jgi:radical SAM protein with 4Fe4S-binding SPASM domain